MILLIEKLVLLFSGLSLLAEESVSIVPVAAFLLIVVITSLNTYTENKRFVTAASLLYLVLAVYYPAFCVFLPLLYFDIFVYKQWVVCAIGAFSLFRYFKHGSLTMTLVLLLFIVLAYFLQHHFIKVQELERQLRAIRDNSQELNNYLKLQNKDILENQDYEIHVARLEERNRIAREIHDNVGHMLSRSILQVGALMAVHKDDKTVQQLSALKNSLSSAMDSIRQSVHDLYDESVDLYDTVHTLIKNFSSQNIDLDFDMGEAIPRNIKFCFIAVIKEALSNMVKHSNATKAYVVLREHPSMYQLLFSDNGTSAAANYGKGLGLRNMEERVEALQGSIHIAAENGFRIFITIPKKN